MPGIQIGFLVFAFIGPVLLWLLSRWAKSPRFAKAICWVFALALFGAWAGTVAIRWRDGDLTADFALPMHLCDWALVVTVLALIRRRQLCFELAYFWGLAGTAQALITPAVDTTSIWRIIGFFLIHSVIPASVLWLMFEFRMRPLRGAWLRVVLWSQIYLVSALIVNAVTGGNYGFLTHRPSVRSMLDLFSDTRWLYILQINLTGLCFFLILAFPWYFVRRREKEG